MPRMLVSERSLSFAAYTLPSKVPASVSITRSAEYSTVGTGRPAPFAVAAKATRQRVEMRAKRVNIFGGLPASGLNEWPSESDACHSHGGSGQAVRPGPYRE